MRPVVGVDCGAYYYPYGPYGTQGGYRAPDNITDDCRINNRSGLCSLERTIIGISCRGIYKHYLNDSCNI